MIEDDEMILDSTAEFLRECGYNILTAMDGLEGFHLAVEHYPDLIISDIAMPVFDGLKLYEMLQQNSDTAVIPFIFLTAMAEKEDIRTGMQLGADDYITKPFDLDELHAAIKTRLIKSSKLKKIISDQYMALFENPLTGVYIMDERKLIFTNQKFLKIFDASNVNNHGFLDIIPANERDTLKEKIEKALKGLVIHFNHSIILKKQSGNIQITIYGKRASMKGKNVIIGNVVENGMAGENILNDLLKTPDDLYNLLQQLAKKTEMNPAMHDKLNELMQVKTEVPVEPNNPDNLTKRETEVLQLICQGMNTGEISEKLFISERTVDTHRSNLLGKTGSKNTANLVIYAIRNGFVKT